MVPVAGLMFSQNEGDASLLACHESAVPPALAMVTTCPEGLACPCVVLKSSSDGVAPRIGGLGAGVSVEAGEEPFDGRLLDGVLLADGLLDGLFPPLLVGEARAIGCTCGCVDDEASTVNCATTV